MARALVVGRARAVAGDGGRGDASGEDGGSGDGDGGKYGGGGGRSCGWHWRGW